MDAPLMDRMKELESENAGFKKMYAEERLRADILQEALAIRIDDIQPGKLQQNAHVERFNRTVRYESVSQCYWEELEDVQLFAIASAF
jgi:putative transposase